MSAPPGRGVELLDAAVELLGRAGRRGTVRVQGQSMTPTLASGQTLGVEFAPEALRRGDLLLFRQQDYLVVHRLLGPASFPDGRRCWRTRGDGMLALDPPVDPARVVGRVVAVQLGEEWRSLEGRWARG
ncbi:MAG TPA: S24/S26 family peptidase, partial [Candidatus Polarisedimenticolaceae bacterium]|nr:S24/S26 family peptidase [Candidatus Polarisedimenticolaceae bacterium]